MHRSPSADWWSLLRRSRVNLSLCALAMLALGVAMLSGADCSPACAAETDEVVSWESLPAILARIQAPRFPANEFPIPGFGAVGDGHSDCKPALDRAIAACHAAGGGKVVVPAGDWFMGGPIRLLSNVNLHLAAGAKVRFSTDPAHYLPPVFTRFEGTELLNYSPLVYAYQAENVAISGAGTLDGQAGKDVWWDWKGPWGGEADHGWEEGDVNQLADVAELCAMPDRGVPPEERVFGAGHYLRPSFVQFYQCRNVLIEGLTVTNSPMWVIHPVRCENVIVRGVTVNSHGPNNDGCNPESCRDVLIEDCVFDTGDDCIAIKSGRNSDGRRLAAPSENIVVRGCTMKDGHGGVVLGSEMSGGIRNVFVENCVMDSPNLERAIRLKSNSLRGGYLENMFVRNLQVGQVSDAVVRINLFYADEQGDHPPTVRNIYIQNVTSEKSEFPFYFRGLEEQYIENVVIENCTFRDAERESVIDNVDLITLRNYRLAPKSWEQENAEREAAMTAESPEASPATNQPQDEPTDATAQALLESKSS